MERQGANAERVGAWVDAQVPSGRLTEADLDGVYGVLCDAFGAAEANRMVQAASRGPSLHARAGSPTGALAGESVGHGRVVDALAPRRHATETLLERLTAGLGVPMSAIQVYIDGEAQRRTVGAGTRGLMQHGRVYLNPDRYDASSADGRGLLAHEVTHVAQRLLASGPERSQSLPRAEREAAANARRFAQGQAVKAPRVRLPAGVAAREETAMMRATLGAYNATLTQKQGKLGGQLAKGKAGLPKSGGQPNSKENRRKKVERYQEGVDGTGSMIEDIPAFEDLRQYFDGDYPDSAGPMSRIRGYEAYGRLKDMWQSAKEGGADSAAMKAAFKREMLEGRGYYECTEKAFKHVAERAMAEAKPDPAGAEAKQQADQAKAAPEPGYEKGGPGEGGGKGSGPSKPDAPKLGAGMQAKMAATVSAQAPPLPTFKQAEANETLFAKAAEEYGHYDTHATKIQGAAEGGTFDRLGMVSKTFFQASFGAGVSGFVNQGLDTLVLDTLGNLGDKGLKAVTKGKLKAPVIGPAITLIQNGLAGDLLSGNLTSGKFAKGLSDSGAKIGKGWESAGKNWDRLVDGDGVGFLFAAAADFLAMLAEVIDVVANVLGTLSAICYIVGAICILMGICLSWLGMGFLVPIGGWLCRAGSLLGKIVTALGPVSTVLAALATFFRLLAAMTVPADAFAEQLGGVEQNAGTLGNKVGERLGDVSAQKAKEQASDHYQSVKDKRQSPTSDPQDRGDGLADALGKAKTEAVDAKTAEIEAGNQKLKQAEQEHADKKKKLEAEGKEGDDAKAKESTKKPKEGEGDDSKRKEGDDAGGPQSTKQKLKATATVALRAVWENVTHTVKQTTSDIRGSVGELKRATQEMGDHLRNPVKGAQLGSAHVVDQLKADKDKSAERVAALETALKKADGDAARIQKALAEAQSKAKAQQGEGGAPEGLNGPAADVARLKADAAQASEASAKALKAHAEGKSRDVALTKQLAAIQKARGADAGAEAVHKRATEGDPDGDLDEKKQGVKDAKDAKKKAVAEADAKAKKAQEALPELKKKKAESEEAYAARKKEAADKRAAEREANNAKDGLNESAAAYEQKAKAVKVKAEREQREHEKALVKAEKAKLREGELKREATDAKAAADKTRAEIAARKKLSGEKAALEGLQTAVDQKKLASAEAKAEAQRIEEGGAGDRSHLQAVAQGTTATVRLAGGTVIDNARIIRVESDGVVLRGEIKVGFDAVVGDGYIADQARKCGEQQAEAKAKQEEAKRLDTEVGEAEGQITLQSAQIEKTREQAEKSKAMTSQLEAEAKANEAKAKSAERKVKTEQAKQQVSDPKDRTEEIEGLKQAAELVRAHDKAKAESTEATKRAEDAKKQLAEAKKAEHDAKKTVDNAPKDRRDAKATGDAGIKDAKGELSDEKASGRGARMQAEHLKNMQAGDQRLSRSTSSGNATGGVGSAYKSLMEGLVDGDVLDSLTELWTALKHLDQTVGAPLGLGGDKDAAQKENMERRATKDDQAKQPAGPSAEDVLLRDAKAKEADKAWYEQSLAVAAGLGQNSSDLVMGLTLGPTYGDLLSDPPTHDPAALGALFVEAQEAATDYEDHWASAYKAYQAELVADECIRQEESLNAVEGDAAKKEAAAQAPIIQAGKAKAQERHGKLSGKEVGTKKSSAEQGGVVSEVATKIAKSDDNVDDKPPKGATEGAGKDSGKAQDKADDDAKDTKTQSAAAAQQQIQVLEAQLACQAALESRIDSDRKALEGKTEQDRATRVEIQMIKAQQLLAADEKKAKAEAKGGEFNAGLAAFSEWAAAYKKKRQDYQGKGGA